MKDYKYVIPAVVALVLVVIVLVLFAGTGPGTDEAIAGHAFARSAGENTYSGATAVCLDGTRHRLLGSCKVASFWEGYATSICEVRCSRDTGKCGVNKYYVASRC